MHYSYIKTAETFYLKIRSDDDDKTNNGVKKNLPSQGILFYFFGKEEVRKWKKNKKWRCRQEKRSGAYNGKRKEKD